jgi:uncharacterized protein YajQ (UPF0234 family)
MPSFDIVSQVNMQEVKNAVDQVSREIVQRYDFKDSKATIELKQNKRDRRKNGAFNFIQEGTFIKRGEILRKR